MKVGPNANRKLICNLTHTCWASGPGDSQSLLTVAKPEQEAVAGQGTQKGNIATDASW